jgi:hypothetical protein
MSSAFHSSVTTVRGGAGSDRGECGLAGELVVPVDPVLPAGVEGGDVALGEVVAGAAPQAGR